MSGRADFIVDQLTGGQRDGINAGRECSGDRPGVTDRGFVGHDILFGAAAKNAVSHMVTEHYGLTTFSSTFIHHIRADAAKRNAAPSSRSRAVIRTSRLACVRHRTSRHRTAVDISWPRAWHRPAIATERPVSRRARTAGFPAARPRRGF